MIALNPDLRLIKPLAKTIYATSRIVGRESMAKQMKVLGTDISSFNLNFVPPTPEWVEVYLNTRRMVGGYSIEGRRLDFAEPQSGRVDIVCYMDDQRNFDWCEIPIKNMIAYDNVTDADVGTDTRAGPNILQRCTPIVIIRPSAGYCRPSMYGESLLYCPVRGYLGRDAITYAILNDSGQMSEPKCIHIIVDSPSDLI